MGENYSPEATTVQKSLDGDDYYWIRRFEISHWLQFHMRAEQKSENNKTITFFREEHELNLKTIATKEHIWHNT